MRRNLVFFLMKLAMPKTPRLSIGDPMRALDLDFERGVVRRNGERVEIAPRSAELLALLVAQQGRLVS